MVSIPRKSTPKGCKVVPISTDVSAPIIEVTETPEERAARIKATRMENLQKALARGREVVAERRANKKGVVESAGSDKKKLREAQQELERQKIAMKWAKLEKEKLKVERSVKRVVKPATTLDDDEESEEEAPKKPLIKSRKPVYESVSEEEHEPDIKTRKPRLTRPVNIPTPPPPQQMIADPINSMATHQIRTDLRKMQLEMMAKQLWGI